MDGFCKTEDCPGSEEIAELTHWKAGSEEARFHISGCDFCAAELHLYQHYPPVYERVEPADIPEPLYELADALLHDRRGLKELYILAGRGG